MRDYHTQMSSAHGIAIIYGALGFLWISLSDLIVNILLKDSAYGGYLQTLKGYGYIAVTALLLYAVINRLSRQRRQSDTHYRQLVETLAEPICEWLPDTTLTYANSAYASFYADTTNNLVGKKWLDRLPESRRESALAHLAAMTRTLQPHKYLLEVELPGRASRWVEWTDIPVLDEQGRLDHFHTIGRDITDRYRHDLEVQEANRQLAEANQRLEEALSGLQSAQQNAIQQERLRALGEMASGIAHDFNNALAVIQGYTDILVARGDDLEPERRASSLQQIRTAAGDAAAIVDRMRQFYRERQQDKHDVESVNLSDLINETIMLTSPRWGAQAQAAGASITVQRQLRSTALALGNPTELREALTNLIYNAVDAMPDGGRLVFRTYDDYGQIVVEVSDTGIGMDDAVLQSCLRPFYTTKGERGSGLGLASVVGIMDRHSGSLNIDSKPGKGTTVTMRFPFSTAHDVVEVDEMDALEQTRNGVKILVVDDEPVVRELIGELLGEMGHLVTEANGAGDALQAVREQEIALVITDLAMPDMNGLELARMLRGRYPNLPIILLTGLANASPELHGSACLSAVLAKPIDLPKLRDCIRTLLQGDTTSQAS